MPLPLILQGSAPCRRRQAWQDPGSCRNRLASLAGVQRRPSTPDRPALHSGLRLPHPCACRARHAATPPGLPLAFPGKRSAPLPWLPCSAPFHYWWVARCCSAACTEGSCARARRSSMQGRPSQAQVQASGSAVDFTAPLWLRLARCLLPLPARFRRLAGPARSHSPWPGCPGTGAHCARWRS